MNSYYWLYWLAAMVLALLLEAATVRLVTVWFAVGALAAAVAALLGAPVGVQVLVFLVVSGALVALLRPLARRHLKPKIVPTNTEALIGSVGVVTEAIDNVSAQGRVKLGAMSWSARSAGGTPIPQGVQVRVERIEGVKLFVVPAEVPAGV